MECVAGTRPERAQTHGVVVEGVIYPPKQAFALATGLARHEFTTETAQRHLSRWGFAVVTSESTGQSPAQVPNSGFAHAQAWPWEGAVQGWSCRARARTGPQDERPGRVAASGECLCRRPPRTPTAGLAQAREPADPCDVRCHQSSPESRFLRGDVRATEASSFERASSRRTCQLRRRVPRWGRRRNQSRIRPRLHATDGRSHRPECRSRSAVVGLFGLGRLPAFVGVAVA